MIRAAVVLLRHRDNERLVFHRLSVGVWALWFIPYIAGEAVVMTGS